MRDADLGELRLVGWWLLVAAGLYIREQWEVGGGRWHWPRAYSYCPPTAKCGILIPCTYRRVQSNHHITIILSDNAYRFNSPSVFGAWICRCCIQIIVWRKDTNTSVYQFNTGTSLKTNVSSYYCHWICHAEIFIESIKTPF